MVKFVPNIAENTKALCALREPDKQNCFEELKKLLTPSLIVALYDPSLETISYPNLWMHLRLAWEQFCYTDSHQET